MASIRGTQVECVGHMICRDVGAYRQYVGGRRRCDALLQRFCISYVLLCLTCVPLLYETSEDTYDDDGVATIGRLLKIKGICIEYRLFYRALLQKRHMIHETSEDTYDGDGVATISRLLKIKGLLCRISSLL